MRSFELNKLVRDKIFTNMQEIGQKVTFRKLHGDELMAALSKKAVEESGELNPINPDAALDELADHLEVIETQAGLLGYTVTELRGRTKARREARGGFDEGVFVERLDLEDDDPFVAYYAADPERFPEVTE